MEKTKTYSFGEEPKNQPFVDLGKRVEEKKASQDPFAIVSLSEVDDKLEDLAAAKLRAEIEAAKAAEIAARAGTFAQQIFPIMAGLVSRREAARGVSEKNFRDCEAQIRTYLDRQPPAGIICRTAYVMAAVKADGGIANPEVLAKDLEIRGLVKKDLNGSISRGALRFALAFEPMAEHRMTVLQALRERYGEAERVARQEHKQEIRDLLATGKLTIWELFSGKPGKFAFYRPFEKVERVIRGEKETWVYKPGVIAGESDGQKVSFSAGLGGVARIVDGVHAAGLTLAVKTLNDPDFRTGREELKPLVPIHKTLWSIRRAQETQGLGPEAEAEIRKLGEVTGLMTPEQFFSSKEPGETLVVFDEKDEAGATRPWRLWDNDGTMRDGDKRYNPVHNFAAILTRNANGEVAWKQAPAHLMGIFKEALNKPLENTQGGRTKGIFGAPAGFYSWAKRKYSPAPAAPTATAPTSSTPEQPKGKKATKK